MGAAMISLRCAACLLVCFGALLLCNESAEAAPVKSEAKGQVSTSSVGMTAVMQEVKKKELLASLGGNQKRVLPPGPFSQQFQTDRHMHIKKKKAAAKKAADDAEAEKKRKAKQGVSDSFLAAFNGFEGDVDDAKDLLK